MDGSLWMVVGCCRWFIVIGAGGWQMVIGGRFLMIVGRKWLVLGDPYLSPPSLSLTLYSSLALLLSLFQSFALVERWLLALKDCCWLVVVDGLLLMDVGCWLLRVVVGWLLSMVRCCWLLVILLSLALASSLSLECSFSGSHSRWWLAVVSW